MLAIAAAQLGWKPVLAVDHEPQSVDATRRNAHRNGVSLEAMQLDLLAVAPPPAPTLAANVPPAVHAALAPRAPARRAPRDRRPASRTPSTTRSSDLYTGFVPRRRLGEGWQAVLLERA